MLFAALTQPLLFDITAVPGNDQIFSLRQVRQEAGAISCQYQLLYSDVCPEFAP